MVITDISTALISSNRKVTVQKSGHRQPPNMILYDIPQEEQIKEKHGNK